MRSLRRVASAQEPWDDQGKKEILLIRRECVLRMRRKKRIPFLLKRASMKLKEIVHLEEYRFQLLLSLVLHFLLLEGAYRGVSW